VVFERVHREVARLPDAATPRKRNAICQS